MIILATLLFFGWWNAYVVIWGTTAELKLRWNANKIWHRIAVICKLYLTLLAIHFSPENWPIILFTAFNLSWTVYDLIINFFRHHYQGLPILHIDSMPTNSNISKYLGKTGFWAVKFILLTINIILFLI